MCSSDLSIMHYARNTFSRVMVINAQTTNSAVGLSFDGDLVECRVRSWTQFYHERIQTRVIVLKLVSVFGSAVAILLRPTSSTSVQVSTCMQTGGDHKNALIPHDATLTSEFSMSACGRTLQDPSGYLGSPYHRTGNNTVKVTDEDGERCEWRIVATHGET